MTNVIDMQAARMAKREEELRQQFNIEPGQTSRPIGFLAQQVVMECRLKMAERRNKGELQ
jgi:hypothetical protein